MVAEPYSSVVSISATGKSPPQTGGDFATEPEAAKEEDVSKTPTDAFFFQRRGGEGYVAQEKRRRQCKYRICARRRTESALCTLYFSTHEFCDLLSSPPPPSEPSSASTEFLSLPTEDEGSDLSAESCRRISASQKSRANVQDSGEFTRGKRRGLNMTVYRFFCRKKVFPFLYLMLLRQRFPKKMCARGEANF